MPNIAKNTSKTYFALNVPKRSHFAIYNDKNMLFAGIELPKLGKNCKKNWFVPNAPKRHFEGSIECAECSFLGCQKSQRN